MWTLIIIFVIAITILSYIIRSIIGTMENGIPDFSDEQDEEHDRIMNTSQDDGDPYGP